jgi:hypothetical protein
VQTKDHHKDPIGWRWRRGRLTPFVLRGRRQPRLALGQVLDPVHAVLPADRVIVRMLERGDLAQALLALVGHPRVRGHDGPLVVTRGQVTAFPDRYGLVPGLLLHEDPAAGTLTLVPLPDPRDRLSRSRAPPDSSVWPP